MTSTTSHKIKSIIKYNQNLNSDNSLNLYLDPRLDAAYDLIVSNLPSNHNQLTLTDIGSGAGLFSFLLYPYWKHITSIEPNSTLYNLQRNLIETNQLENVQLIKDQLPNCLGAVNSDVILLVMSLYLTNDWLNNFKSLIGKNVSHFFIVDGPDKDISSWCSNDWKTPAESITNRKPMLEGVAWELVDAANELGFVCNVYDIESKKKIDVNSNCADWLIIGNKNGC